jgi:hypothetical protein
VKCAPTRAERHNCAPPWGQRGGQEADAVYSPGNPSGGTADEAVPPEASIEGQLAAVKMSPESPVFASIHC